MAQEQLFRPRSRFVAAALSAALALGMAPAFSVAADSAYADDMMAARVSAQEGDSQAYDWVARVGGEGKATMESTQNALTYVDSLNDVAVLEDGSIVAAGAFDWKGLSTAPENHDLSDGIIIKYDAAQNEVFRTCVGGTADDYFSSVAQLKDGGFVAVGFAKSTDGDMNGIAKHAKATLYDGLIARFDADGKLVDKVAVGGTGKDYLQGVVATSDGGFAAVGRFSSTDGTFAGVVDEMKSSGSAFVVKYDKDMNQQWLDVVAESESGYDELVDVVEDAQGNLIACGYLAAPPNGKGGKDGVVVKYDKDGNRQWLKVCGSAENDEFWSVSTDVNATGGVSDAQGYVVAGYAKAADEDFAGVASAVPGAGLPVMARLDADGNLVRAAALDAEALDATANIVAYEDGYLMAGSYKNESAQLGSADGKGDVYVARLRADFSLESAMSFAGDDDAKDVARAIALAPEGKAIVAGRYLSSDFCGLDLQGKADGFLMQVDPAKLAAAPAKQYTAPASVKKVSDLTVDSMAAAMVYEQAYVKQYGEGDAARYEVTFYLQDATIMGMSVAAQDVKAVKYDSDNDDASDSLADRDVYLPTKHVREVTVTVSDLTKPIVFNTCPSSMPKMPDAALLLDADETVEVDEAPDFFVDDEEVAAQAQALIKAAAANPTEKNTAAARAAFDALTDAQKALLDEGAEQSLKASETAVANAKAAADKAAALAAASTINKAKVTAADVKKASDLGATTITLGPKVKKIAKGAFAGTKITTIIAKTKKLAKKSVKGCLKGSKVKTVKVQVGNAKANKKVVKKYKKIFTKKVAGKKAKVTK